MIGMMNYRFLLPFGCIRLYEHIDFRGRSVKLHQKSDTKKDLRLLDFNDITSPLSSCNYHN